VATVAGWVVSSTVKNLLITPVARTGNVDIFIVGDATGS
jgi:hypothetical protein